jgi:hypothetical protein
MDSTLQVVFENRVEIFYRLDSFSSLYLGHAFRRQFETFAVSMDEIALSPNWVFKVFQLYYPVGWPITISGT